MRYKIVIIILMSILSVNNMECRSLKLAIGNYSELYDIMFSYIYIETFGVFDDLYAAKTEDAQMYKEYLMGENLLTKSAITRDALLPDNCIFGFRPMTIHPADTYLILKSGDDYEILLGSYDYQTWDSSYILYQQLSQAYEFFQSHQSQMDVDDFPVYAKIICEVFIENSKYLE